MTEWRKVHEHYEVSSAGEVRSLPHVDSRGRLRHGGLLTPYLTGKRPGYPTVHIDSKNRKVHKLVADAFLPPDEQRPQINHKNGDCNDNRVENLERCTAQENVKHAFDVLGKRPAGGHKGKTGAAHHSSREIMAFPPSGDDVQVFGSAAEAARALSLRRCSVVRTANGVYAHTGGYTFAWVIDRL